MHTVHEHGTYSDEKLQLDFARKIIKEILISNEINDFGLQSIM